MVKKEGDRARRVDAIVERAQRTGHVMSALQKAILVRFANTDPAFSERDAKRLAGVREALEQAGRWQEYSEWRIMTSFDSSITRMEQDGQSRFQVRVECDGQVLACSCPTVEKAYAFMSFYEALITDEFYSVGPPWADAGLPWSK